MKCKMPTTPFAMRLSGSAKETELRIRNIFQWKKKRPPVIFLVLLAALVLLCGGLVGFVTTPGSGTLEELYADYFTKIPAERMTIAFDDKDAAGYPLLTATDGGFVDALEYLRSMELCTARGENQYIGNFDSRGGAITLRGAGGWELKIELYPATECLVVTLDESAKVYRWPINFDRENFLGYWKDGNEDAGVDNADTPPNQPEIVELTETEQWIKDYYAEKYPLYQVSWASAEASPPQENDMRLTAATIQGECRVGEVNGEAYQLDYTVWTIRSGQLEAQEMSAVLVLTRSADGTMNSIAGEANPDTEGKSVEQIILEVCYNLNDLEVSLQRDGYPGYVGMSNQVTFFREVYDGPEQIEVLEGWEPIYSEGDYWARHTWDGLEALCYHAAESDAWRYAAYHIDTTRTDLATYRGIRVGDSREAVLEAYSDLLSSEDYWGKFPGEDYLWYCRNELGFGGALIFFFGGDTVSRIVLDNMFN